MAEYHNVKISIWSDSWFRRLTPTGKLLYMYLFTNPLVDINGVQVADIDLFALHTGIAKSAIEEILGAFESADKLIIDGDELLVVNFIKCQIYRNVSVEAKRIKDFQQIKSPKIKNKLIACYHSIFNTVSTGCQQGVDRVRQTETETETEIEKEIEIRNKTLYGEESVLDSVTEDMKVDVAKCPHKEIVALYHRILPKNPQVVKWDERRANKLRNRWKDDKRRQNLKWWENYFLYIADSPFLIGDAPNCKKRFDLEWFLEPRNMLKILEGQYHAKG